MNESDELTWLDATAQAELVRRGQVSPVELVEAAIARIERLDPQLNAVIRPLFDTARETARGELPDGPLRGVPYLLKDLGPPLAGVPLIGGSAALRDNVPEVDAYLIERLRAAGLVFVGKTNTPEFGLLPTTEPRLFGPTLNPWDRSRSSGGSSGGSAAAVAAGMVPAAHGNDGGGSIRIPASCCGLFGLKPSRGRVSMGPHVGDRVSGLTNDHALTRSVRDSAALLDAVAGPAPGDPYQAPAPARPYVDEVGADPGTLRIRFATTAPRGCDVHPDCVRAVEQTATLCERLGHHVEPGAPEFDVEAFDRAFVAIMTAGLAAAIDDISAAAEQPPDPDLYEPTTWAAYEIGKAVSGSDYLRAVDVTQSVTRQLAGFFDDCDLWLTPTLTEPPLPLGSLELQPGLPPRQATDRILSYIAFTPICNGTGVPAASVPLHWNDAGLPIGVQLVAPYGAEDLLFRVASQLEAAQPWAHRHPPIST